MHSQPFDVRFCDGIHEKNINIIKDIKTVMKIFVRHCINIPDNAIINVYVELELQIFINAIAKFCIKKIKLRWFVLNLLHYCTLIIKIIFHVVLVKRGKVNF